MTRTGIDTSLYGCGNAKSVEELFDEIRRGECTVCFCEEGSLRRIVQVVRVDVFCDGWHLVEAEQLLPDGRTRPRKLEVTFAARVQPSESLGMALARLKEEEYPEELRRTVTVLDHVGDTEECKESGSYPSLLTRYLFHTFHWEVVGLSTFRDLVVAERDGDGKIVTYKWVLSSE